MKEAGNYDSKKGRKKILKRKKKKKKRNIKTGSQHRGVKTNWKN